ncbi:MAG: Trm112 family protein [Stagnimonas sp.]|nr:Trm112 family protein [Stagnimonas sp.]
MDKRLLEILVCPVTQAPLVYKPEHSELWCRASRLAYPVRDGVPVMLEEEARALSDVEADSLR